MSASEKMVQSNNVDVNMEDVYGRRIDIRDDFNSFTTCMRGSLLSKEDIAKGYQTLPSRGQGYSTEPTHHITSRQDCLCSILNEEQITRIIKFTVRKS